MIYLYQFLISFRHRINRVRVKQVEFRKEIERYLGIIENIWLSASDQFPDFLEEIPNNIKVQNEAYLRSITEAVNRQMNHIPRLPFRRKSWKKKTYRLIQNFLYKETVIGIHHSMEAKDMDAFYEELMEFLRKSREFSPELPFEELGQAIRNYIVYAMFKVIHRVDTGFSSAGFGYSMLYPFTDNYIDNTSHSPQEKQEYNQFIRDTLNGKKVQPATEHHRKTYELLKAIEADYPRTQEASIYTLLLVMLEAQEESIRQQRKGTPLTYRERLSISLLKGGVSVLVDRFLINKALTEADYIFYLGFGFFLQLADDLQDIGEDRLKGYQTLFTVNTTPSEEEKLVNKLLHFLKEIMETFSAENDRFQDLIFFSSYQLIYSSLIGSKEFFTEAYRKKIEQCLPVTVTYLEAAKANMGSPMDRISQDKHRKVLKLLIE